MSEQIPEAKRAGHEREKCVILED